MGLNQTSVLGRQQRLYVRSESAAGTWVAPRGQDAIRVKKADIKLDIPRVDRTDARQHPDRVERITHLRSVTFAAEGYFAPSGTAGTAPDEGELLRGLFGVETVNASTSVVYTLSGSQTIPTFTAHREDSAVVMRSATGVVINQGKFSGKGGSEAMSSYTGLGMQYAHTGTSTLNDASALNGDTTVTIQTADIANFSTNSYIQIGTSTGHQVTGGAGTATLTISPGLSGGQSNGAAVTPYVPTETISSYVLPVTLGTVTLASTTLPFTEYEVEIDNGFKPNDQQGGIAYVTDFIRGFRTVKGSVTVRATKDQILFLGKYNNSVSTTQALTIAVGNVAGYIATFSIPYAEINLAELDVPEADEALIKLPFEALASSSGNDAITLTFT